MGFSLKDCYLSFALKKYLIPLIFYSCDNLVAENVDFYNLEWARYLNQMKDYSFYLAVTLINL